jgi:hypothetical protein
MGTNPKNKLEGGRYKQIQVIPSNHNNNKHTGGDHTIKECLVLVLR